MRRIRGRALQRIRKTMLNENPLCEECAKQGRIRAAVAIDHKVALINGGLDAPENRQRLCKECHDTKTAKDMGYTPKTQWGADGMPLSPDHHWNTVRPMAIDQTTKGHS